MSGGLILLHVVINCELRILLFEYNLFYFLNPGADDIYLCLYSGVPVSV